MKLSNDSKLLIIGGTKFVGKHFVNRLIRTHEDITIFSKRMLNDIHDNVTFIKGDRNILLDMDKVFTNNYDIVIDFCCHSKAQMESLLNYSKSFKGVVFISSSLVEVYCENDNEYVDGKKSAEELLKNASIDYLILRPTILFGEFEEYQYSTKLMLQMLREQIVLLPKAPEDLGYIQPLYVGDFIDIIFLLLEKGVEREIFNVGGKFIKISKYLDIMKSVVENDKIEYIYLTHLRTVALKHYTIPYNEKFKISNEKINNYLGLNIDSEVNLINGLLRVKEFLND